MLSQPSHLTAWPAQPGQVLGLLCPLGDDSLVARHRCFTAHIDTLSPLGSASSSVLRVPPLKSSSVAGGSTVTLKGTTVATPGSGIGSGSRAAVGCSGAGGAAAAPLCPPAPSSVFCSTARAGNHRKGRLSALRAHTKAPYKMDFHRKNLRNAKGA